MHAPVSGLLDAAVGDRRFELLVGRDGPRSEVAGGVVARLSSGTVRHLSYKSQDLSRGIRAGGLLLEEDTRLRFWETCQTPKMPGR